MAKRRTTDSGVRADAMLAAAIADRAVRLGQRHGVQVDRATCLMAVMSVHRIVPLRMAALGDPTLDDANFAHDVFGILRHYNPESGELEDCFRPRFAAPMEAKP